MWTDVEVTAVEYDPKIAAIYKDFFPQDNVMVADAHAYLLEHFEEYDFIWASPPCPTHSRLNTFAMGTQNPYAYPDMALYQEILILKHFAKHRKWCIENVISYYDPLIKPIKFGGHYYWSNFYIKPIEDGGNREHHSGVEVLQKLKGFDLSKYKGIDKVKTLRNCVESKYALHILDYARKEPDDLFKINSPKDL